MWLHCKMYWFRSFFIIFFSIISCNMNMFFTKHVPSNPQHPSISAEVHMAMLLVHRNSFLFPFFFPPSGENAVGIWFGNIDERTLDKFLDAARSFYETAYNYCRKWLPWNDPFLKHCQFVNFDERLKHSIEDVMQIITMMPRLHGKFQVDVR